jgi:hypothetical protein
MHVIWHRTQPEVCSVECDRCVCAEYMLCTLPVCQNACCGVCVFQLEGLCMVLVWRVGIGRRRSITHSPLGLSACNLEDKYTSPVAISITTSMCDRTPYTQSATRLLRTCYSMLFGPGHLRNGLVMSVAGVLVPKTQLAMFCWLLVFVMYVGCYGCYGVCLHGCVVLLHWLKTPLAPCV